MNPVDHDELEPVIAAHLEEDLRARGVEFTALELRLPDALGIAEWAAIGRRLCRADQVMQWWLGDWAAFGERKYGQLKEFADANHIDYGYLRNAAWVSRQVELSRRRDNVPWTVHQEVAALKPREQASFLEQAAEKHLPRAELRRQIRASQGEQNALVPDGPAVKFISKACDDLAHWLRTQPGDFWTAERKLIWRKRLEPVVKFWESLG